jgi:hypothetical protein
MGENGFSSEGLDGEAYCGSRQSKVEGAPHSEKFLVSLDGIMEKPRFSSEEEAYSHITEQSGDCCMVRRYEVWGIRRRGEDGGTVVTLKRMNGRYVEDRSEGKVHQQELGRDFFESMYGVSFPIPKVLAEEAFPELKSGGLEVRSERYESAPAS